ncbi:MAG: restriction endonuclease subunit S [Desulfobacteraceae bacterium]|nr:MAG: restriction endonuclease subunit S [Desulfobacteraceae bacterium]
MKGWHSINVKDLCNIDNTFVQTGPFGSQLHESDYSENGIPVIMPKNIVNGKISENNIARVSDNHANRLKRHKVIPGDIIYGRRGDIGRHALIGHQEKGWLCGTGCLLLRLNQKKIFPPYSHYYLSQQSIIDYVSNQAVGATMPNLNTSILKKLPVLLPPLPIQRKIAAILSAYDDLIENNNRRISILEKMAEELYREWFVRLRFPGHENVKIVKGVPEGWAMKSVEDAFKYLGGGTPSTSVNSYWQDGHINWYSPTDLTASNSLFSFRSKQQITEQGLKESSARLFPAYSIMMTSRATIGQISINTTPACTNQGFITCIPNDEVPLHFLYYWLKLNKSYFIQISSGATFLELTKGKFKNISMLVPDPQIVGNYVKIQKTHFESIEVLLKQNELLSVSRDRLLTRLMSGKIDVAELDIQFPPSMKDAEGVADA